MKEIKGDLVKLAGEGVFDVIVHSTNCFCCMGAGIAKQIRITTPEVYHDDMLTVPGDRKKLGTIRSVITHLSYTVVNAYIQYGYGSGGVHVSYDAVRSAMKKTKEAFTGGERIGLPLIGAGLAGGDWAVIKDIIDEELNGLDVTVVHFDPSK